MDISELVENLKVACPTIMHEHANALTISHGEGKVRFHSDSSGQEIHIIVLSDDEKIANAETIEKIRSYSNIRLILLTPEEYCDRRY